MQGHPRFADWLILIFLSSPMLALGAFQVRKVDLANAASAVLGHRI